MLFLARWTKSGINVEIEIHIETCDEAVTCRKVLEELTRQRCQAIFEASQRPAPGKLAKTSHPLLL